MSEDIPIEDRLKQAEASRDRLAGEVVQIRAALNTVSVYEGLVDVSPVAMMVQQLASDHEALEQRIENVLTYVADNVYLDGSHIQHLLRGGSPVPDTIEGLDSPPGS